MIVYLATNSANGKEYVGLTSSTLSRRRKEHLQSTASGSMTAFHCALRKYGADAFSWIILYSGIDRDDLNRKEIEEIASRRPAYNMTSGGDGVRAGHKHSRPRVVRNSWWNTATPEQRAERGRQISEAKKGKTPNWKIKPSTKGRVRSE